MATKFELEGIDYASVKGKSVLIVGGGSGSGLASGLALAKAGARVTIADSGSHADAVITFQSHELAVQYVRCDVTSWSQQLMAFKQAVQFAPNRSLDIVCSFLATDSRQDLVEDASQSDSRIDIDPVEPVMEEIDVNVKAVCHLTKLAMHFFKLPDKVTNLKKGRTRSGSSGTSYTASSIHSDGIISRTNSRPQSRSRSRPASPSRGAPPSGSSDAVVITEEPEQKAEEQTAKKPEGKDNEFKKLLLFVCGFSAYADGGHSNFKTTSSFALRGLFRSLRTKCQEDLNVRVNLVSTWATRDPSIEPILEQLEKEGVIEKETVNESTDVEADVSTKETETAEEKASEENAQNTASTLNGEVHDDEKKESPTDTSTDESASKPAAEASPDTNGVPNQGTNEVTNSDSPANQQVEESKPTTPSEEPGQPSPEDKSEDSEDKEEAEAEIEAEPEKQLNGSTIGTSDEPTAETTAKSETPINYKKVYFTSSDDIARTVSRLCSDSTICGRAIAVMPDGAFDLHDDYEGGYAGESVKALLTARKELGDIICKVLRLVPDTP